jgi:hypothetical protein
MHFPTEVRQFPAVIKADRTRAHNRDSEVGKNVARAHFESVTTLAESFSR